MGEAKSMRSLRLLTAAWGLIALSAVACGGTDTNAGTGGAAGTGGSSGTGGTGNPCDGVTCSGHGTCIADGSDALCDCDPGFLVSGVDCVVYSCTGGECALLEDLSPMVDGSPIMSTLWLGRGRFSNAELDRGFRVFYNLGLRQVKIEVRWSDVEPANDAWQWATEPTSGNTAGLDVDHVISLALRYNMAVIPYLTVDMPWGAREMNPVCEGLTTIRGQAQAPDPVQYAEYALAVVRRFRLAGVDVPIVELDNEAANFNDGYTSWSCFLNISAAELKAAEDAAYQAIKAEFPDTSVASSSFLFPGLSCNPADVARCETDKERSNSYIQAYFEDAPTPQFDFLALHNTVGGSGNPWSTSTKPPGATYAYNFGSYNDAYQMRRTILDGYGFAATPIIDLESATGPTGKKDAVIVQRNIFARVNAQTNRVAGVIVSQLSGSALFTENADVGLVDIRDGTGGFALNEGYFGFYTLKSIMPRYPIYVGNVAGTLNTVEPWVEEFSDGAGGALYVAFRPYQTGGPAQTSASVTIQVAPGANATITAAQDASVSSAQADGSGALILNVDEHPLFVEVN